MGGPPRADPPPSTPTTTHRQGTARMEQLQQGPLCSRSDAPSPSVSPAPAPPSSSWPLGMLAAPRVLANGMELSVHACTRSMAREVKYIFPHLHPRVHRGAGSASAGPSGAAALAAARVKVDGGAADGDEVLIVPTIQKSRVDTVRFGAEVEEEKDRCLEYFADFAKPLCEALRAQGHWADYIDPCSGLPVLTPHCTRPYSEVAGFEHLLRYKTQNAGCCKILLHPRWGSSCYPATIFTTAPFPALQEAILRLEGAQGQVQCQAKGQGQRPEAGACASASQQ